MKPVIMPQIGQDISAGKIVQWLKEEGESVRKGEAILVVESEKASFAVEAEADGVLVKILHKAGDEVEILKPVAYLGRPGEALAEEAAALDQQIELVAGCFSRDPKNTRMTGEQLYLDPARCYDTWQEMVEGERRLPKDRRIDFVSIVTQTVSHFQIAKAFLEAGFHVVCDKPTTFNLKEARDLAKLVEKTGRVLALTHNYTGHPMVRHAREMFRSGQMGQVRKVLCIYLQDFLMFPHEKHGQKQAVWPMGFGVTDTAEHMPRRIAHERHRRHGAPDRSGRGGPGGRHTARIGGRRRARRPILPELLA